MSASQIYISSGQDLSQSISDLEAAFPNTVWKYGYFSGGPFSGPEYGNVSPGGVGSSTGESFIAESGATQLNINIGTQHLSGDVANLEFGTGLHQSGTNFYQDATDFRIENVQAGDSTSITSHDVLYGLLSGDFSPLANLLALNGTEQHGTAGNEGFLGFGGVDTFFFTASSGNDVINAFNIGDDVIDISGWTGGSLAINYVYDAISGLYDATIADGVNGSILVQDIADNSLTIGGNVLV
jgi:hypothetical protein